MCVDSCHFAGNEIIRLYFDVLACPGPMRQSYSLHGSNATWHDWRTSLDDLHGMQGDFFIGISLSEVAFEVRCLWSYNANLWFLTDAFRDKERRHPFEGESWKYVLVKTLIRAVFVIDAALTVQAARNQGISLVGVSCQSLFQLSSSERLMVNEQERPECSHYLLGLDKFVTLPVENGAIIEPYLYSFRTRLSNNIKFTDIDRYGAPLLWHVPFGKRTCKKMPHGAASSPPLFDAQRPQS
jgi:hypothetical protein